MLLHLVAAVSRVVAGTTSRRGKIEAIAGLLKEAESGDAALAAAYLAGAPRQGRLGVGWETIGKIAPPPAETPRLELSDVDGVFSELAGTIGPGSVERRRKQLEVLLARATAEEQDFLRALILQEVRQGANQGVVVGAVARAAGVPIRSVQRALMLRGDLGEVAAAAGAGGAAALAEFRLALFVPLQSMLAATGTDVAAALDALGEAAVEYKYDGARIQVHRVGERIAVYTRNLNDVTHRVPEIVDAVSRLGLQSIVLDGEAIALDADGRPLPFSKTMGRFGSEGAEPDVLLTPVFFDLLHLDGRDLLDLPAADRYRHMDAVLPPALVVPRKVTADPAEAAAFQAEALAAGHEGVVVKSLSASYEAGRRGSSWLKVKPVHTLDLVVLAAEWGHGRRRGRLSNLHLGARRPREGGFVMLGKTFKGLTDDMLVWQTRRLLELEVGRRGNTVMVRPELVVEVAFDGVQSSQRYPGGVALRFARIKGYRPDKAPAEADTIDTVLAIHRGEVTPG